MKKNSILLRIGLVAILVIIALTHCHAQVNRYEDSVARVSVVGELGAVFFDADQHDFIIKFKDGTWHSTLKDSLAAINAIFAADSLLLVQNAGLKKIVVSLDKISSWLYQYINVPKTADSATKVSIRKQLDAKLQSEFKNYLFLIKVYPLNEQ